MRPRAHHAACFVLLAVAGFAQEDPWRPLTRSGRGYGPVAAHQVDEAGDYRLNRLTDAARPGETLVLWGSGLRSDARRENVLVYVGGWALSPAYAGPAPGLDGVDQINVALPEDVRTGCFVPLVVMAGGTVSSIYTVSIGWDRVCQPELRLLERNLTALDEGGTIRVHALAVWTEAIEGAKRGTAEAWIADYDVADAAVLTLETVEIPGIPGCSRAGRSAPAGFHGVRPAAPAGLSVTGANGCSLQFKPGEDGVWRAPVGPACVPTGATVSFGSWGTFAGLETNMPWPAVPVFRVERGASPSVSWFGGGGGLFGFEARSLHRLPGNLFGGQIVSERRLFCRLQGDGGLIPVPDLVWALGLPESSTGVVRRQGFVSSAASGAGGEVDFSLTHVRHDLTSPLAEP